MTLIGVFLVTLVTMMQAPQAESGKSALESDPKGWIDLLADKDLKQWTRVPLNAVGQLPAGQATDPSPWKLDPSGTLLCEGDKAGHEMFRYVPEFGDFILHAEWRFTKLDGQPNYNSGVYARAAADASIWHQAQTGPTGGYLFGNTLVQGAPKRVNLREAMKENRVKPAGEWNTYEIRAVGKTISLWVNGAVTSEFTECEVPRGHVGLEAEGYRIEFRNLKVKRLD
jgi:hypothetical protein